MAERLEAVLTVIYLVFNEGYLATRGASLVRTDLCAEAIRLGRLLLTLDGAATPGGSARRSSRSCCCTMRGTKRVWMRPGEIVVLEDQDRSRWNQKQIAEALLLLKDVLRGASRPVRSAGCDCGGAL